MVAVYHETADPARERYSVLTVGVSAASAFTFECSQSRLTANATTLLDQIAENPSWRRAECTEL